MSAAPAGGRSAPRWLAGLAVAALAISPYLGSLSNGFTLDDVPLVAENVQLRQLSSLPRLFRQDYFAPTKRVGLYRPLVMSSYALTFALFGESPLPFHVTNVVLHAAVSLLLLSVLLRLARSRALAIGAALLFAAHAVHSEVVANVTFGRPELLAAFLGLLCLRLHLAARRAAAQRRSWLRAGSLASFAAALLCKESAVTVLGLLVLVDWLFPDAEEPILL